MTHTLAFGSVWQEQVLLALSKLKVEVEEVDGEAVMTGETPLGEMKARVNFSPGSGQLTVTILEKPAVLSVDTIKMHIRTALDEAAHELEHPAVEETAPTPTNEKKPCGCPDSAESATAKPVSPVEPPPIPQAPPAVLADKDDTQQ